MARKRTIDPSIWCDEAFGNVSRGARLLFLGIVTQADDHGRLSASAIEIRNRLFPGDVDPIGFGEIEAQRGELNRVGLIVVFRHGGKLYLQLPGWHKNQVQRWMSPSKIPALEDPESEPTSEKAECADAIRARAAAMPVPVPAEQVNDVSGSGVTTEEYRDPSECADAGRRRSSSLSPLSSRSGSRETDTLTTASDAAGDEPHQDPDTPIGDYAKRHRDATGEAPLVNGKQITVLYKRALAAGLTRDDLRALMDIYFALYREGRDKFFATPAPGQFFAAGVLEKLRAIRRARGEAPATVDLNTRWSSALSAIKAAFPESRVEGVVWRGQPFYTVRVGDASASLDDPSDKTLDMVAEVVNALGNRPASDAPAVLATLYRRTPAAGAA